MLTTNEFLDAVKAKHGIASDYKLGQFLELSENAVSHYRKGRSLFDTSVSLKVADALGIDRAFVVACVEHERAERAGKDQEAAMWEIVAGKFIAAAARKLNKAAAIFVAVLLSMFLGGGPDGGAQAHEVAAPSPVVATGNQLCIMSNVWRRFLGRLRLWLGGIFHTSSFCAA